MRSDEELLKEIESQDFDPNAGKTYTKKEDVQLIVAHLEQLSACLLYTSDAADE